MLLMSMVTKDGVVVVPQLGRTKSHAPSQANSFQATLLVEKWMAIQMMMQTWVDPRDAVDIDGDGWKVVLSWYGCAFEMPSMSYPLLLSGDH